MYHKDLKRKWFVKILENNQKGLTRVKEEYEKEGFTVKRTNFFPLKIIERRGIWVHTRTA